MYHPEQTFLDLEPQIARGLAVATTGIVSEALSDALPDDVEPPVADRERLEHQVAAALYATARHEFERALRSIESASIA